MTISKAKFFWRKGRNFWSGVYFPDSRENPYDMTLLIIGIPKMLSGSIKVFEKHPGIARQPCLLYAKAVDPNTCSTVFIWH